MTLPLDANDLDIIRLLGNALTSAVAQAGWTHQGKPYAVWQKNQPTQQGIPTSPTIFFEHLFDVSRGWQKMDYDENQLDPSGNSLVGTETQLYEFHYQVSAWVIQDPNDLTIPTASDVLNKVRMYLQSRNQMRIWRQNNVGVLRIQEVRNPYIQDDRQRFEATPSFDIVFTNQKQIAYTVGRIKVIEGRDVPI
jgi:hypothetical protein